MFKKPCCLVLFNLICLITDPFLARILVDSNCILQEQWRQRYAAEKASDPSATTATAAAAPKYLEPDTAAANVAVGGKKLSAAKIKFSGSINAKQPPTMPAVTTESAGGGGGFETDTKKHIETTIAKMIRRFDHNYTAAAARTAMAAAAAAMSATSESDGWHTEDTDDDDDEGEIGGGGGGGGGAEEDRSESSAATTTTTSSCCSSPTPRSSPKRSPMFTKKMKKFKKRAERKQQQLQQPPPPQVDLPPKIGDVVVTETACVYSTATVVWQDGTIEEGISSRQLYPIHHLDEHVSGKLSFYCLVPNSIYYAKQEFFPGDFVLTGVESDDVSYRDYGVIQRVDHIGRTAIVKWFSTYPSTGDPT